MIRIWSLTSGTCLKVFEGHNNAVLKTLFINSGTQIISADTNGLIKVWMIKTNSCLQTFDEHKERVWGIAIRKDGKEMITGGEDSRIVIWKDNTKQVIEEEQKEIDESVLKDQEIKNLVRSNKYHEALNIAISINRPRETFYLIEKIDGK